jgi:AraC-like DNA-binding protein
MDQNRSVIPQVHTVPAQLRDQARTGGPLRLPAPGLRRLVCGYGGFRCGATSRRVLPVTMSTLIIDVSRQVRVLTGARAAAALYDREPWSHGVAIGLTPAGSLALLGIPAAELTGETVPLDGRRFELLAERLAAAPDWPARFDVLDAVLGSWCSPVAEDLVTQAWWRLHDSAGRLPIGRLAEEFGVSRRHLEYGFRRSVGLTPKTVARIVRFQHAVDLLGRPHATLGGAVACGYADQPHLTREFRALAGLRPGELFAFLQDVRRAHA